MFKIQYITFKQNPKYKIPPGGEFLPVEKPWFKILPAESYLLYMSTKRT